MRATDDSAGIGVFDFVFVAEGYEALCKGIVGLFVETSEVVLIDVWRSETRNKIRIDDAGIPAGEVMLPVFASAGTSKPEFAVRSCKASYWPRVGGSRSVGPGNSVQLELLRTVRRS